MEFWRVLNTLFWMKYVTETDLMYIWWWEDQTPARFICEQLTASVCVCCLFVCLFVAVCSSVLKCFHRFLHRRLNVVTIWDTSTFLMTVFERCNSHTSVALWLAGCGVPITRINTGDVCVFLQNHEHVVTLGLRLISPQSCRCWHISVSHRPTVCYLLFLATIIFFDTSVRTARIWK